LATMRPHRPLFLLLLVLVLVSCKTRRRSTTTLSPPWSHDSPGELGSTNEKGGTRRSSTNERRRHRTLSTSTSTTTSSTEPPSRLPALEEKVVWPVQELVAILGGVLGFWGGVGSMGALFLLVLMTQRFFCRRSREDKKEGW